MQSCEKKKDSRESERNDESLERVRRSVPCVVRGGTRITVVETAHAANVSECRSLWTSFVSGKAKSFKETIINCFLILAREVAVERFKSVMDTKMRPLFVKSRKPIKVVF